MIDQRRAEDFAREWVEAWNAHDLDRIMAHYDDDVVFTSPFVAEVTGRADGTIEGAASLRPYFTAALARSPDLHFADVSVLVGASSVCLLYRMVRGLRAAEVMVVDEGRVRRGYVNYAPAAGS